MARFRKIATYIATYFFTFSTILRSWISFRREMFESPVFILLVIFSMLLIGEPIFTRKSKRYTHVYLAIQTIIIASLLYLPTNTDFFAVLFFVLTLQAIHVFPSKIGFGWMGVFISMMAVLMIYSFGWSEGITFALNYMIAYGVIGAFIYVAIQAEVARAESQRLLVELQDAHKQLQEYSLQAEELAIVQERNRLARNLHDSVTQTIFTINLTAEAAQILHDRDSSKVGDQLRKLQELSKSALGEMRSLVFELRPTAVAEQGLVPALRQHLVSLERQHRLYVNLDIEGEPNMSIECAQRLFRIIQEALNNIIKHAQVDKANIALKFEEDCFSLQVEDKGKGFSLGTSGSDRRHMGLASMRERAEMLGGNLTIETQPGEGTSITLDCKYQ